MDDIRIWSTEDHKQKRVRESQGKIRFELMANKSVRMKAKQNSQNEKKSKYEKKVTDSLSETKASVQQAIQMIQFRLSNVIKLASAKYASAWVERWVKDSVEIE